MVQLSNRFILKKTVFMYIWKISGSFKGFKVKTESHPLSPQLPY